jgi:hypothetical protein
VRRLLVVCLIALFGVPLIGATPSAFVIKPSVIVYPLTPTGSSIDREASSRLATLIATQMANTGLVSVVPPPPGTERKDYLTVARARAADYYVTGFISPLGSGASVVMQVVSSATGIVIFSQSAQITTYTEAAGQGDDIAQYISRHANRGLALIPTPPPQAGTPTPAPSGGPEANLGKLFGRRGRRATPAPKATATAAPKATPAAPAARPAPVASAPAAALTNVTPAPAPAVATPSPAPAGTPRVVGATAAGTTAAGTTYAILPVEGSADAALRELATEKLVARTSGERAASIAAACAVRTVHAVLAGTLSVRSDAQFGGNATFELVARDCAGKVLWQQTHGNDAGGAQALQLATERAVDAAVGAYLNPPKRRRR